MNPPFLGVTAALAIIAGCASRPPTLAAALPPAADPRDSDPSFDWQVLLVVPMGSALKSIPLAVHEALLFHDEAAGADATDEGECYAPDSPAPRFLGRTPDAYLLCFKHDRLTRIRAAVHLSDTEAEGTLRAACARWQRDGATAGAEPAGGEANAAGGSCAGRRGPVRYRAELGSDSVVLVVLDGAPDT